MARTGIARLTGQPDAASGWRELFLWHNARNGKSGGYKNGNAAILVEEAFKELKSAGIETEFIQLANKVVNPCQTCFAYAKTARRIRNKDNFNPIFDKMLKAQGIILASPVYSADAPARMKALIERAAVVCDMRPECIKRKTGAGMAVARRA